MKICLRRMFHVVLTSKCACGSLTLQKKDTFFVSPDNRRLMRRKCKIRGLLDGFILTGKPWIAQKNACLGIDRRLIHVVEYLIKG